MPETTSDPELPIEQLSRFPALEGTRWKLAGIAEASTGKLRELEPKDCETCYTLTFDTDSTAEGRTASNDVAVNLGGLNEQGMIMAAHTKVGETGPDAYVLYDFTGEVRSYEYRKTWSSEYAAYRGALNFFNEAKDSYLQYLAEPLNEEMQEE
jgi:hypothetical protein